MVAGRGVEHARQLVLRIAESAERLWSRLSKRITSWSLPADIKTDSIPSRVGSMPPPTHSYHQEVLRW